MPVLGYLLDGNDLWTTYGLTAVRVDGLDDPLKRKGETGHDWPDEDGEEEYVTSKDLYFAPRDLTLRGQLFTTSRATLLSYWDSLRAVLESPSLHILKVPYHAGRSYYVYSKDGGTFSWALPMGTNHTYFLANVTIMLREPNPARAS